MFLRRRAFARGVSLLETAVLCVGYLTCDPQVATPVDRPPRQNAVPAVAGGFPTWDLQAVGGHLVTADGRRVENEEWPHNLMALCYDEGVDGGMFVAYAEFHMRDVSSYGTFDVPVMGVSESYWINVPTEGCPGCASPSDLGCAECYKSHAGNLAQATGINITYALQAFSPVREDSFYIQLRSAAQKHGGNNVHWHARLPVTHGSAASLFLAWGDFAAPTQDDHEPLDEALAGVFSLTFAVVGVNATLRVSSLEIAPSSQGCPVEAQAPGDPADGCTYAATGDVSGSCPRCPSVFDAWGDGLALPVVT